MFRNPEEMRRRLNEIVEKFRQKGATGPERALTIQELGLPPRFEQAMNRRLGQTGIFAEINGKYYLNEERLKQIQEQHANIASGEYGSGSRQHTPSWLRYIGLLLMLPIG
jgi:lipoate-protein ligase A